MRSRLILALHQDGIDKRRISIPVRHRKGESTVEREAVELAVEQIMGFDEDLRSEEQAVLDPLAVARKRCARDGNIETRGRR